VDGDDWIELDTLEICVNELHKDENIGCILFSYAKELPSNSIPMHIMDKTEHFLGDRAEKIIYRRLFGLSNQELAHPERMENIVSCCMKLYRVDFAVKGQYFDTKEVGSCEDGLFNMYALHKCHNMLYLDRPMYHYRKAGNSLTSTFRPRFIQQWETLFSVMDNIIYEKHLGYDCKEALNNRIALSITAVGLNELSNPEHRNMEHIRVIRSYLKKDYYREAIRKMQMANMPFAWKILMKSCKMRLSWVTYGIIVAIKKMKMRG
jgi:glycosyltransferase EpsH